MKIKILSVIMLLLCGLIACQEDNISDSEVDVSSARHEGIDVLIENGSTSRVIYDGFATKFAEGDKIGVYSDLMNNQSFTINGELRRAYSDAPVTMERGTSFYAYYPYREIMDNLEAVPITINPAQVQSDVNFSHIAENDFLVAPPTSISRTTVASFQHVGTWIDLLIYNRQDSPLSVTDATIKSSSKSFVKSGTIDITLESDNENFMKVIPTEYTDELAISVSGDWAKSVERGKSVTLRVALLPSDLSNDTISITINTNQGQITQSFIGRNFERAHAYQLAYNDKQIYIPGNIWVPEGEENFNFRRADLHDENSYFCWKRSKQSENLILFWEEGFGDDPATCNLRKGNVSMNVNVDQMLQDLERYYALYRDELKFIIPGYTLADQYKMMIFLYCTDAWYAFGGDIDSRVGAFWVSPVVAQPAGRAIAHELGHAFQGQVRADSRYADPDLLYHGSNFAGFANDNIGTRYIECCANYMALQNMESYKNWDCEIPIHQAQCHKGFTHSWAAYQCFYIHGLWEELHGRDFVGRLWRYAKRGEDIITAYKRYTETSQELFNDQIWQSAAREQTWSCCSDEINQYMRAMVDRQTSGNRDTYYTNKTWLIHNNTDDYYRCYPDIYTTDKSNSVNYAMAPQSYGYNAIHLNVPVAGTEVTIDFEGLSTYLETDIQGYRYYSDLTNLGWRWGVVACTGEGGWTPVYSEIQRDNKGSLTFEVPQDTKRLVLIVSGAPQNHIRKDSDQSVENDYEYPYRFKVSGTTVNTKYVKLTNEEIVL